MKSMFIAMAALMLVACGGSDVAGPSGIVEHDVEYVLKTLSEQPQNIEVVYRESGEVSYDTLQVYESEWNHEFKASDGDVLHFTGQSDEGALEAYLYIDGEMVYSAGSNAGKVGIVYTL